MIVKALEIRDAGTFIPVIAIKMEPANEGQRYLAARMGYGTRPERQAKYVTVVRLGDCGAQYDPNKWPQSSRTMIVAHKHILENFDSLADGDVVDVEYILELRSEPKISERELTGDLLDEPTA